MQNWLEKCGISFKPVSPEEKEKALTEKAEHLEQVAGHEERVALLKTRIRNAEKRIKKVRPNVIPGLSLKMSGGKVALILIIIVVLVLAIKACGGN